MQVWMCELVICVCVVLVGVSGIERKGKPVVFSYSSADLPHPATISHHYRSPVEPSAEQQFQSARADDGTLGNRQSNVNGVHSNDASYQSTPAYYGHRPSENYQPQPTIGPPIYDEPPQDYDYVTVNPNQHYKPTTAVYYDDRPMDSNQYYPNHMLSTIAPPIYDDNRQDYDYSPSSSPIDFHSTTPSYYDDRPDVDNSHYDANPSTVSPPVYNDNRQGYNFAVINPDNSYHSTTVTYYDRSPGQSYLTPTDSSMPTYDNHNHDYDYSTTSPHFMPNRDQNHHSVPQMYGPGSTVSPHPDYEMGSLSSNISDPKPFIPTNDFSEATTQLTDSFVAYPNKGPEYPYQPAPPQFTEYSSPPPKRRRIYSSTANYYEDNGEIISTTPIAEFEFAKEKLPPVQDYPPPNPGYITRPFKQMLNSRKNPKKLGNEERAAVSSGLKTVHHGDKVLQQPKFFAYSSDLEDDRMGEGMLRGGVVHHSDQDSPHVMGQQDHDHQDYDDHELDLHDEDHHKKKEEQYAKGGGQEHHAEHKGSGGDKGDKGYKSSHKYSKGKKGHHDKENHKGKYVDEKGKKGKKKEEGGHYGENHQAEKGKKAAKYGESGEHKKGHSTKGEHNIHKKDEYMKKHEFYDEHHEGGDHENYGGFMAAHDHKKGGKKKKGHHKSGSNHHHKEKKGHHEKGEKKDQHKGYKDAKGYDGHFAHHKKYGKKGGHKKGKIWGYTKGHPK